MLIIVRVLCDGKKLIPLRYHVGFAPEAVDHLCFTMSGLQWNDHLGNRMISYREGNNQTKNKA